MIVPVKRALVSVTDKSGLAEFAAGLDRLGIKILSTGGTGNVLVNAGIPFKEVSSVTGSPEIFGGRVKTLHPNILGAILYRRGNKSDEEERHKFGINTLDLVVVNLYDFKGRTSGKKISNQEAVEAIDIGGPSMIRAAAKN
ncbi:MAG: bifunctional phosphoribosylaminoimidazolecarboxamide formyltransferase/IMP cyclohydrolase, partial [Candidatus Electryonea clarkiae]|nr:bifunctional phosphoribosylaminoimidazolecarboxamide formyltransferase/IMP cyclohydrolase [Candidatus Electryonea clarkiae]